MTERWRKKLEDIDGASPSDDVFERAKAGSTHRNEALPGPRMSTRVVTIVAAFLVFALAISVFAIPALRMRNTPAGEGTGSLHPIWPAQTAAQLDQLQANPPAWTLDPQRLAERFGAQVMGWALVSAQEVSGLECPVASGANPAPSSTGTTGWGPPCTVSNQSPAYPTLASSGSPAGAFRTFSIVPCSDRGCVGDGVFGQQYVQVYQPLEQGDGDIWAVLQARGGGWNEPNTISVTPGQNVHDGSSISASFARFPLDLVPTLAYAACASTGASSAYRDPAGAGTGGIALDVHVTGSAACSGPQPGYVWAASGYVALASGSGQIAADPLLERAGLLALTAVPVTMVFPTTTSETTAPTSPTSEKSVSPTIEPSQWTTFDGGLAFTMELPADWGRTSITDEIVVNAPGGDPYIQINRVDEAPRDDSSFPLDFADYEGVHQPHFYGDGQTFIIQWFTGTADPLSPEQSAVVERIVESIRFEPWTVGDSRNTFTAIGKALRSATAEWITYRGENYLSYIGGEGDGGRVVYGPAPRCLPGGPRPLLEVRETGVAAITCQDGQSGQWRFNSGEADSANDQRFAEPLPKHRAILSSDGFMLVDLSSTIS